MPLPDKPGLYTSCSGESLHDALGRDIRRHGRWAMRWLPGTTFTDGQHMYEVVYGCQGSAGGWVAGVRTDYLDTPEDAPERLAYSLFHWSGHARDGVLIGGTRRPLILRLVAPAPRLEGSPHV